MTTPFTTVEIDQLSTINGGLTPQQAYSAAMQEIKNHRLIMAPIKSATAPLPDVKPVGSFILKALGK